MDIKQNLVPSSKYPLKCPNLMTAIGICVHNTANDAPAKNEISYMVGNDLQTSFHFAVDDVEVWQGVLTSRNAWHAGDGSNGVGNRKYIGVEICYSKSGGSRFTKAEENASELIAQLLKERNWGVDKVKKHQDFSGKYCPHRTLDLGWNRFITMVQSKLSTAPVPQPPAGGSMADLFNWLGVADEASARAKIAEHVGEKNGKANWGEEPVSGAENFGGHLGDSRRQVTELRKQLANQPVPPVFEGWENNGMQVQVGHTTYNYAKKD